MAEEGKFPHEESKHSEQGIYPVRAIDNTSDVSNWVESWGPDQIKEWQNEDSNVGKFKTLKSTTDHKPNRQTMGSFSYEIRILCQMLEELKTNPMGYFTEQVKRSTGKHLKSNY